MGRINHAPQNLLLHDEPNQISQMKTLLHEWSTNNNTEIETHEYSSVEQFLFDYESNACDLLLLDIEMTGLNGTELAKSLRAKGDLLPIVFITGFSEYMSDGYDVEALHYLLKPVKKEKLFAVLDRYIAKCSGGSVSSGAARQKNATAGMSSRM